MHAVLVTVDVDSARLEEARQMLAEVVVPTIKGSDGFVRGTWMRAADGASGRSVIVFDTEEHARAAADRAVEGPPPGAPATVRSAEVFEVVAEA